MSPLHRLSGLSPSLVVAVRNVSRAKVRSGLAAAAVMIGVVAIGAIGAGGAAFKQSQFDNLEDQGVTNVFVTPGVDKTPRSFDREDLRAIGETVGPAGVVATRSESVEFVRRGDRESLSVTYIDDPRSLYEVKHGTVPDNWRRSVVLSASFAAEHGLGPGDRLRLVRTDEDGGARERDYRVAAVLAPTQSFGASEAFLPFTEAGTDRSQQVRVTTGSVDRASAVADRLRERFNGRKDRILVFELTSLVRLFRSIVDGINAFLAGLAAISLLVATVSITNTMLMAVLRRREEIGALRAVGYRKGDIVRILLAESALLGAFGAAAGTVVAVGVAAVANAVFLGNPLAFSRSALGYLAAGAGFGVLCGLLAGVYPAWRAANERPVDALRG